MSETTNDLSNDKETQARVCAVELALTVAATSPEDCVQFGEDGRLGLVIPQAYRPLRFSHYVAGTWLEDGSYVITDQWLLASVLVTGALRTPFATGARTPEVESKQLDQPTRDPSSNIVPFPHRSSDHDLPL